VDLNTRERLIADMSVKITRSPDACSPSDIQNLRDEGFSDKEYKATLINSAVTGKIKVPQIGETKAVA